MVLAHALDIVAEASGVEVVVAVGLDEHVLVNNVVEADGAGAGGNVGLCQELLAHVNDLEDDWGAQSRVFSTPGGERAEQTRHAAVQEAPGIADLK